MQMCITVKDRAREDLLRESSRNWPGHYTLEFCLTDWRSLGNALELDLAQLRDRYRQTGQCLRTHFDDLLALHPCGPRPSGVV